MIDIPVEVLALPALSLASGIDLYLTLLLLGAAPTTGLWEPPLPGALGDLDSPFVLITVGAFYIAEFTAERYPLAALVWNALHAVIRPVSGGLLALLLLDGQGPAMVVAGAALGGILASWAHSIRTGAWVLRDFRDASPSDGPSPLLVSAAEDVAVLGTVSLALDLPGWSTLLAVLLVGATAPVARSYGRAFAHAIRLGFSRIFRTLGIRRWRRSDELPDWVAASFRDGDALRGCVAGAWRLPGAPRFANGWIMVRGGRPLFLFRSRKGPRRIDLADRTASSVRDRDLYRRIDLGGKQGAGVLVVGWTGPSTESLEAEFTSEPDASEQGSTVR